MIQKLIIQELFKWREDRWKLILAKLSVKEDEVGEKIECATNMGFYIKRVRNLERFKNF